MDSTTTLDDLKRRVQKFCEEREWDQFHNAKDLAVGAATEAAELLQEFRFCGHRESNELVADKAKRADIENEIADVLFFLVRFAQRFDIDLDTALANKMEISAARYPVEKSRGKKLKYTEL